MEFNLVYASDFCEENNKKVTINSIEELKELSLKNKHSLVVSFKDDNQPYSRNEIIVYDYYLE